MSGTSRFDYWNETRRPLINLLFVLPLLVFYELGVWWNTAGLAQVRNGADEWLRTWLSSGSWTWGWALPLVVAGVLLIWHLALRQSWKVRTEALAGMTAESLIYACVLVLIGQAADGWMRFGAPDIVQPLAIPAPWVGVRFIHFLGAGLYEEFLFRLCLIPALYLVLRFLLVPGKWSLRGAIAISSLIFALAHYLTPTTDATLLSIFTDAVSRVQSSRELWFGFAFRGLAGVLFGVLFVCRGFGIAVGCHAAYDIVVGIILLSEL